MEPFVEYEEPQVATLLSKLKETLKENKELSSSLHAFYYLKTASEWKKKKPDLEFHVLVPNNGKSMMDGTFFLHMKTKQPNGTYRIDGTVHVGSEESHEEMGRSLREWWKGQRVSAFLFTALDPLTRQAVGTALSPTPFGVTPGFAYWMPSEEAAAVIPRELAGVEVKEISPEWSEEINSTWPHRFPGSECLISDNLRLNYGLGVFDKSNGKLLSWGMLWFYGGIGIVGTLKGEERKGYASLVVESLTQRMGKDQMDVHLFVVEGNEKGNKFFQKLGFKLFQEKNYWIHEK